jgi:Putative zinc-finger
MRCEECQTLVEDYFDGELDEQTISLVAQHINACPSCASLYDRLEREQELYLRYECDAEPAPAFWANVMKRAAQESSPSSQSPSGLRCWFNGILSGFGTPRFSPSLTALIVLVAVGITAILMSYVNTRERVAGPVSVAQREEAPAATFPSSAQEIVRPTSPTVEDEAGEKKGEASVNGQPQLVQTVGGRKANPRLNASVGNAERINRKPSAAGQNRTPDELVREAEQKYVAAIAMLSRDVNRRRSRLDAATIARFERTLSAIDRTIADTRRAARRHPNDPVAAQYMLTAYAKKVDVLREMIGY